MAYDYGALARLLADPKQPAPKSPAALARALTEQQWLGAPPVETGGLPSIPWTPERGAQWASEARAQRGGMNLGPSWLGMDVPLAEIISPMGARIAESLVGPSGVGQFLPGLGDLIDARDAIDYAGQAVGAGFSGDWGRLGTAGSLAAIAAMGAMPGIDAPPARAMFSADDLLRPVNHSNRDAVVDEIRRAGAPLEFKDASRNFSERFGPSDSSYWRLLAPDGSETKVRFSDHDNGVPTGVDIRYGQTDAASALAMMADAAGVPPPPAVKALYDGLAAIGDKAAALGLEIRPTTVKHPLLGSVPGPSVVSYTDALGRRHDMTGLTVKRFYAPGGWREFLTPDGGVGAADEALGLLAAKRAELDTAAAEAAARWRSDPSGLGLPAAIRTEDAPAVASALVDMAGNREIVEAVRAYPKDAGRFLALSRKFGAPFDGWKSAPGALGGILAAFRRVTGM